MGIVITITESCKNGSRTFVLSNLYHHIKVLLCIVLENGIWESLINTWARMRHGYHLFVKVIVILLLMNDPNHRWTINIKAYRWKGFSGYRIIVRYYKLVLQVQTKLIISKDSFCHKNCNNIEYKRIYLHEHFNFLDSLSRYGRNIWKLVCISWPWQIKM